VSGPRKILSALRSGPKSNRELQDLCCDHGGGIARNCAKLTRQGLIKRIDGLSPGRGRRAIYALASHPSQITGEQ